MKDVAAARMALEGEVSIYQAAELRAELAQWLALAEPDSPVPWVLDLRAVTEFDSAGLQLLVSALKTAQQQRVVLRLEGASAAVQEVCALLNLDDQLQAMQKEHSA